MFSSFNGLANLAWAFASAAHHDDDNYLLYRSFESIILYYT